MKLYYSKGACSLAVRILLHELGLDSQFESVDLKTKKTETGQDFYRINPKGVVPVLELDDHNILTENAVIHQYLAEKYNAKQLLPPADDFMRYHILEWLNFVTTELHKGFSPLFNPVLDEKTKDFFKNALKKKFALLDEHFKQNPYLAGEHYTLPDGYLFVMLLWAQFMHIDLSLYPHLHSYFQTLKKRNAIHQSLMEEGLLLGEAKA